MLTTALNFLSDKRKRFHRSDTMPIFTNDSNLFKLNSDNQLVENQKQCNKNKDYDDEDIVSVNVCKKSDVNCQDETLLSKSVCYQGGLSSSSKSCALRQLSSNDDNDDDDYDTEFVKLPSFSSTEKNCPEGMKMHSNEKHLSVGNLNKYQFLNLETNLYRHQKNLSNSPPHGNTSQGCLSHGYSLSSMQVPLNPTGSENNVFTSFTVWKKDSSDLRHIPKDGKTNSSAACKVVDGSKSVRLPSKLSESHALVSDDLNSELTLDHSTKATSSGKSKVVRMRARAVARAAKGKLKRSKSSAYMSRQFRDLPSEDNNVRGRSSSAHRDPDISVQENKPVQTSSENKPRPGLVRSWIDKNPRLRLDTSPQRSSNASNIGEVANADEVIEQLVNKANAYKFQVINALEHFKPLTEVSVSGNAINSDLVTAMQNNNYSPKILSSRSLMTSANNSAKPNRYSVVKKLRRNNSSIACSNDQLPTSHEEQSMISTSSTAGDLLLPSKNYKTSDIASEDEDDFIKNITGNLFTVVRNDDCEQFLKLFDHYQRLKDKSFGQIQKSTNEFGLSALDSAHLTASLPLISCLMVCGFSPGPVIQSLLNSGPKSYSHKLDRMGQYLQSLLEEKEIQLTKCKVETKNAIARANHLTITESSKDSCSLIQPSQQQEQIINTTAFAEVAMKEKELQTVLDEYEYLSKLIENYSRFPKSTKPPNKVNIYLNSSNSILIRISPPKNGRFIKANFHQNSADTSDVDTCYKNNRVECDLDQDQSSCESTDNDLIHDPINEGRKINGVHQIHSNNFILYYCIEWSTCPKFSNSEVYNSLVQPPIRVIKPYSHSMKHKQFSILRVGFYCLNNLPENKMVFVRVFAFSIKGWSEPCYANPNGIVLSSWIDNKICELYRNTVQRENLSLSYTKYVGCTLDEELDTFKNNLSKQLFSWTRSYPMNSNTSSGSSNSTITGVPVNTVEETSKRTKSPMLQRKRSFRFPFSNKGLKFVKQTKSGVYLAVLYHTPTTSSNITMDDESGKFKYKSKIVLADDYIPILSVSREDYTNESTLNSDFNWFARIVSDSFFDMDLQFLYEDMPNTSLPTNLQLRVRLLEMLQRLKLLLGTSNLGTIYPEIIRVRSIDSSLINLKQTKNENSDIQEILSTPKVSTETNDSIATSTSYESNPKSTSSFLFVLVKRINNPNEIILTGNLRWCHLDKFLRQNKVKLNNFFRIHSNVEFSNYSIMTNMTRNILLPALYPHLLTTRGNQVFISPESQIIANLDILLGYSERHMHILEPGLYIVLVQMKAHMDQQAAILVSNTPTTIHMLPAEKIRSRSHVSKDEWYSLCRLVERTDEKNEENFINLKNSEKRFVIQLTKATLKLTNRLCYGINDMKMFRIFLPEIIRISPLHAFILLLPPVDQVCLPPTSNSLPPPTCSWIPMTYFERHLGISYDPLFHNKIQHLISLLELIIPLSQFAQRQCLTESDLSQISERTQSLQSIQTNLENMFQTRRWLSETISIARDRKKVYNFHITVEQIINEYYGILKSCLVKLNLDSLTDEMINFNTVSQNIELNTSSIDKTKQIRSSSVHSDLVDVTPSSERVDINNLPSSPTESKHKVNTSVIQVYAAYPTGLNPGVSVRLLINIRTTVREVIDIVVKRLLETAERKSIKASDDTDSLSLLRSFDFIRTNIENNLENHLFCLTVSVGELQRCLPNTVRLLLLRKPWRYGKLTVRLLNDLSEDIPQRRRQQQRPEPQTDNQNTSSASEFINSGLHDQNVSPLLTVTFVQPNLKQATISSPPEILP